LTLDYVILDIEFNGRKFASDLPMEVIEIGAVRLDSELRPKDEFTSLIKPVYFSKLNSFIKKKTGIPQEDIDIAPSFPKVIADFEEWLGRSESVLLFTWGGKTSSASCSTRGCTSSTIPIGPAFIIMICSKAICVIKK